MASTSTSRIPIHRHWKKSPPNTHAISLIHQVRYKMEFDEDKNDGMLDVFEVNTLKPKGDQQTHWRRFPASYLEFLQRFNYQFELYIESLDLIIKTRSKSSYSSEAIRKLKHYVQYMDNVIMEIWEDTRIAAVDEVLGADWRCTSLDEWLRVEYHIKRHDIPDVEKYVAVESRDWMSADPFELGKLIKMPNTVITKI